MPNSTASPAALDFVTALGRLLQSGPLRDAFAADAPTVAAKMNVRVEDRASFLQLVPDDLEAQAVVLLRKRFDLVRHTLPRTCAELGKQAWPEFRVYARNRWPQGDAMVVRDAWGFCAHLRDARAAVLCPREWNRLRFAHGTERFAIRYARAAPSAGSARGGVQVFFRHHAARWHEWWIYFGL